VLAFNERGLQFPCELLFSASDNDVSDHHRASDDWFVINCLAGSLGNNTQLARIVCERVVC
jgi:hypothetical protein